MNADVRPAESYYCPVRGSINAPAHLDAGNASLEGRAEAGRVTRGMCIQAFSVALMPSPILTLRVTPDVHREIIARAETAGTTVTDALRVLIESGLRAPASEPTQGAATPTKTP